MTHPAQDVTRPNTIDSIDSDGPAAGNTDSTDADDGVLSSSFHTDQVLTVAGGHFMHDTFSAFLAPLLPMLQVKLGTGYALTGGLVIFTQLPSLLNPFIGYLADRISLRYFVILAPAVTATLMSLIGFAPSYFALALLLLAVGVSVAAFHAPAPAMIARVSGKRVGTGMSFFMASGELGRTIGPLVAVAGVTWWGLEGIWRLAAIGWLTSAVLYWRLHRVAARPESAAPCLTSDDGASGPTRLSAPGWNHVAQGLSRRCAHDLFAPLYERHQTIESLVGCYGSDNPGGGRGLGCAADRHSQRSNRPPDHAPDRACACTVAPAHLPLWSDLDDCPCSHRAGSDGHFADAGHAGNCPGSLSRPSRRCQWNIHVYQLSCARGGYLGCRPAGRPRRLDQRLSLERLAGMVGDSGRHALADTVRFGSGEVTIWGRERTRRRCRVRSQQGNGGR